MSAPKPVERPLSPFMIPKYYRLQMTSASSFATRLTGHALILSALLVVWWLLAAAMSDQAFAWADRVATGWFGDIVFTLSVWAIWYHYLAGLRHLYFDALRGMELRTAERLGWALFIGATVLTPVTILLVQ